MEDVLLQSTTLRLAKSIFVWIPRLPTMRVMGSHDMSTSLLFSAAIVFLRSGFLRGRRLVAGFQFRSGSPPLGLVVERFLVESAEGADHLAVRDDRRCREQRSFR